MTDKPTRNMAASVRQRLLNRARADGDDFQLLLTRYCIERLLYRLSRSEFSGQFVLKGAMLFSAWGRDLFRPTRDLDLLGRGDSSPSRMEQVFKTICATEVEDDGLAFDAGTVRAREIREAQEYGGVRVEFVVRLGRAKLDLQVDIGFGDALVPRPRTVDFPALLDFPQARIAAYRPETVIAEKFQAMVALGIANSRMKDFYDLWTFASEFEFGGMPLCRALKATFARRETRLPTRPPTALTDEFHRDASKQAQWRAFLRKDSLDARQQGLGEVIGLLSDFLMPPTLATVEGRSFDMTWADGGPWEA